MTYPDLLWGIPPPQAKRKLAELPEELFGCVRIEHIVMKDAHKLDLSGASTPP